MAKALSIGWIGLGKMGVPMSKNLVKAGYSVTVWNRSPEKTEQLQAAGAQVADSISELSAKSNIVISMISDDAALTSVSDQILEASPAGQVYIDMSTVSPIASSAVADHCAKRQVRYLRAPVSGSTALAEAGTLTIFASGPQDAYTVCEDVFSAMGQKSFHVGEAEEARYLKLVLNMMVGLTSAMVGEALVFGKQGGMDWEQMIDIVNNSVVASPLVGYKAQMLKDRNFSPAFTIAQIAKDFDIALDTGKSSGVAMPMTSLMRQFLSAMMSQGKADLDFFGYLTLLEQLSGSDA